MKLGRWERWEKGEVGKLGKVGRWCVWDGGKETKRQDRIAIGTAYIFSGDCSWHVQMRKNEVVIKGKNSL